MIGVRSRTVAAAVPSSWQVSWNVATTSPFSGSVSSDLPLNIARSPFVPGLVAFDWDHEFARAYFVTVIRIILRATSPGQAFEAGFQTTQTEDAGCRMPGIRLLA